MIRLEIERPGLPTEIYEFEVTQLIVGRGSKCDIRIKADGISRNHARFDYDQEADKYYVTDLGSTNGTFIQGEKIEPGARTEITTLFPLQLGKVTIVNLLGPEDNSEYTTIGENTQTRFMPPSSSSGNDSSDFTATIVEQESATTPFDRKRTSIDRSMGEGKIQMTKLSKKAKANDEVNPFKQFIQNVAMFFLFVTAGLGGYYKFVHEKTIEDILRSKGRSISDKDLVQIIKMQKCRAEEQLESELCEKYMSDNGSFDPYEGIFVGDKDIIVFQDIGRFIIQNKVAVDYKAEKDQKIKNIKENVFLGGLIAKSFSPVYDGNLSFGVHRVELTKYKYAVVISYAHFDAKIVPLYYLRTPLRGMRDLEPGKGGSMIKMAIKGEKTVEFEVKIKSKANFMWNKFNKVNELLTGSIDVENQLANYKKRYEKEQKESENKETGNEGINRGISSYFDKIKVQQAEEQEQEKKQEEEEKESLSEEDKKLFGDANIPNYGAGDQSNPNQRDRSNLPQRNYNQRQNYGSNNQNRSPRSQRSYRRIRGLKSRPSITSRKLIKFSAPSQKSTTSNESTRSSTDNSRSVSSQSSAPSNNASKKPTSIRSAGGAATASPAK